MEALIGYKPERVKGIEIFRPRSHVASIFDVDLEALRRRRIRGLILDLDNTLLPYGSREVPAAVLQWVKDVRAAGFQTALVTNNRSRRVRAVASAMEIPVAQGRFKPSRSMLRQAMAIMGTSAGETALLGDQLFTDILAGNRLGLYTILVTPIAVHEFPATRLVRMLERFLLKLLHVPPARRRGA